MGEHDEVIGDFLVECYESLFKLDRELVRLEEELNHRTAIGDIFRTVHSMKSACGFLSFPKLEALTHEGETLLATLRDGDLRMSRHVISGLLALVDAIRQILSRIEETGAEGDGDYSELQKRLRKLQQADDTALEAAARRGQDDDGLQAGPRALEGDADEVSFPERLGELLIKSGRVRIEDVVSAVELQRGGDPRRLGEILVERAVIAPEDLLDVLKSQQDVGGMPLPQRIGDLLIQSGHVTPDDVAAAVQKQVHGDPRRLGEILIEQAGLRPSEVLQVLDMQSHLAMPQVMGQTVRVESALLDRFTNQVTELLQRTSRHRERCSSSDDDLAPIVGSLVEILTRLRMQPLSTLWNRLPRFVHDLAQSLGKQVRVEMQGKDLQVDRAVIDGLKDSIAHLVRNAVDHGIEPPEARTAGAKPATGTLQLLARLEDEVLTIEVSDDGAGIDPERVRERAVELGMAGPAECAAMSDREALRLIFRPGFSMSRSVTHVSGRGVGMDVVRTHVERIGGVIDVISRVGVGTTFRIRLTAAMGGVHALHELTRRVEQLKARKA